MFSTESIAIIGLLYLVLLFLIAHFGDTDRVPRIIKRNKNIVYALSLAVYCSSWTFYGAVGTAAVNGLDYLAIYFGPILVFLFGYPVMRRIILISKQNNITSISDFIASRFAKSRRIALLVTVIALVGSLPYIALQLKAVTMSVLVLTASSQELALSASGFSVDLISFCTGIILALFAILFGTRHLDNTEHHRGMVLAISFESIVKLLAILAVGYYAFYLLQNSNLAIVNNSARVFAEHLPKGNSTWISFLTKTFLSFGAIMLLPRQFQVTVVEAEDHRQFKTARIIVPIYLILTSIIVVPIALTGSILLPEGREDLYVLSLPMMFGNEFLSVLAFLGGLSAATGMVIVAVISLSTMACNDLVMPCLIRIRRLDILNSDRLNEIILLIRRAAILLMILGTYGYYKLIDENEQLADIGLVSFAAVALFLPAVFSALFWRKANSRGVFWGLVAGFGVWLYTLLLPTIMSADALASSWASESFLSPQKLFGIGFDNSLTHGVIWSLSVNIIILVYFSFKAEQSTLETMQASRFYFVNELNTSTVSGERIALHPDALRILSERIIGIKNTNAIFRQFEKQSGVSVSDHATVDRTLLSLVQKAIAGVIGSASAQKVVTDTVGNVGADELIEETTVLVDQASSMLSFNRKLLQTALENITHGISVVDKDLNIVVWNDRYLSLFDYPENFIHVGKPIQEVLEYNANRGDFGDKNAEAEIAKRLAHLNKRQSHKHIRTRRNGVVVKSIGEPLPDGGFVTTYEDITESVNAAKLLRQANEELEDRVRERTVELEALTKQLEQNTRSKTHFLAAASHDLLQPISAARLFANSVLENSGDSEKVKSLASNIDQSLVTANELLRALLDISKLDAGGIEAIPSAFSLQSLLLDIVRDLNPAARNKEIDLQISSAEMVVESDRRLLRAVLQNLLSNAVRYTPKGGWVELSAEIEGDEALIKVKDNGVGIAEGDLEHIFTEFYQVKNPNAGQTGGLGLGLSIVNRICRLLGHRILVESKLGQGSEFSICVPLAEEIQITVDQPLSINNSSPLDQLQGLNVLCIDNEKNVLAAMKTMLESWGCRVSEFSDFNQAHDAAKEGCFDIVLADYRLDGPETGLDLLTALKARRLKVKRLGRTFNGVLITAEQNPDLQPQTEELGFYYLPKPIEPAMLKSLLLFFAAQQNDAE